MTTPTDAVRLSMALTWQHGLGGLSAFFAGLERNVIVGSQCPACGRTTVPLRTRCSDDAVRTIPVEFPPVGLVFGVTTGKASHLLGDDSAEHIFAHVQIDGTDNRILVRIDPSGGPVAAGSKVRLVQAGPRMVHPVQHLVFMVDQTDAGDSVVDL